MGALDERLRRGPDGCRQRLAQIEVADLAWIFGDRITPGRLAARLDGMERAIQAATRQMDAIEAWSARAETAMTPLSGRTLSARARF